MFAELEEATADIKQFDEALAAGKHSHILIQALIYTHATRTHTYAQHTPQSARRQHVCGVRRNEAV